MPEDRKEGARPVLPLTIPLVECASSGPRSSISLQPTISISFVLAQMAIMASSKRTWLVAGCSSGLGDTFSYAALKRGDNVIATASKGTQGNRGSNPRHRCPNAPSSTRQQGRRGSGDIQRDTRAYHQYSVPRNPCSRSAELTYSAPANLPRTLIRQWLVRPPRADSMQVRT